VNVTGCNGSSVSQDVVGPSVVKCQPSVTGVPTTIGASGGEVSARIVTTADCSWSVTTNAAWLRVEPAAGQGEAVVTIHVSGNQVASSRTGEIDLNGVRVQVAQAAAPPPPPPPRVPEPEPQPTPPPPTPAPTPTPTPAPPAPAPTPTPSPSPPAPTPTPAPPAPAPAPAPAPTPNPPAPTPPPPTPTRIELSGAISGLSGTCPTLSFTAGSYRVNTDDETKFTRGPCKKLTNGMSVGIVGEQQANKTVYALRVELD
jgi:hypothetical protein